MHRHFVAELISHIALVEMKLEASSKTLHSSSEDVPTDERAAKFEECFVNVGTSLEASA